MRKNTKEVFEAWRANQKLRKCQAVWTDGRSIYSYLTQILFPPIGEEVLCLNLKKYSITTTIQQNGLRFLLEQAGIDYSVLE